MKIVAYKKDSYKEYLIRKLWPTSNFFMDLMFCFVSF